MTEVSRQVERRRKAEKNVGRRCHWRDRDGREEGAGTIVSVVTRGSWPMYRVEWDVGTPDWWGDEVSASHGAQFMIEPGDD